jgi:hypothetical protein
MRQVIAVKRKAQEGGFFRRPLSKYFRSLLQPSSPTSAVCNPSEYIEKLYKYTLKACVIKSQYVKKALPSMYCLCVCVCVCEMHARK